MGLNMQTQLAEILQYYPEVKSIHPACDAVPEISEEDYLALVKSIREDGLANDITLTPDGQLLDGRNRLRACYDAMVDARFAETSVDPWTFSYGMNIARRHLTTGQKAMFGAEWKKHEAEEARKRQTSGINQHTKSLKEIFPEAALGQSRDKAGDRAGVSGKSVDKAEEIKRVAPDIAKKVLSGELSLEAGYKESGRRKKQMLSLPVDSPQQQAQETTKIVTHIGVASEIAMPKKVVFNKTNESVDWASWTWNPVTGCLHGCSFCYAREIANSERMRDYYPNKFEPTFHEYRLAAPGNTAVPSTSDARDGRVFVCSMADLFGKWVPDEWINKVFDSCLASPEWEYLFLTKWPARYSKMPLLKKAWYGASVIQQSDVKRVEKAMKSFETDCIKWISLEPMTERIVFEDLNWCDFVAIGSQTSTSQPEGFVPSFAPEFDWVVDVVNQCRDAGVPYFLKSNLGREAPGMKLPQPEPKRRIRSV